jgi:hypothetical protein
LTRIGQGNRPVPRSQEAIVRNFTAVSTAFAASALLFSFSPGAPAQTWMETHPLLTGAGGRAPSADVPIATKGDEILTPYREARLRPDDESKPDDGVKIDRGSLDHPANASGESSRHE